MKFLIPNHRVPDSFVDNVAYTLEKMGHEVVTMPTLSNKRMNSPVIRILKENFQKLRGDYLSKQEKWLHQHCADIKPNVLLCLTQGIDPEILHKIKQNGIQTVAWWGDTAANMKRNGLLAEDWDWIFIKDHYAAEKLRIFGLNAHQLFEAMNPYWHKPIETAPSGNLVVAGSFYDTRNFLVAKLLKAGVPMELYGGRLPKWADQTIKDKHSGKFIIKEEKSKVFSAALGVLNSTAMSENDSVNCRAFEIAGTGALQFMEYRSSIKYCFEPEKEILLFKNLAELQEQIQRAQKDKQWAKSIREAALKRALAEHTYRHRLEFIIKCLKG